MGRQNRNPHHGTTRLHKPTPMRASRRSRTPTHILRTQRCRDVRSRIRQHLWSAIHVPPARTRRQRPASTTYTQNRDRTRPRKVTTRNHLAKHHPNRPRSYAPQLSLQLENVEPLELDASKTTKIAELVPTVDGKPDLTQINDIDLNNLAKEFRTQKIIFEAARDVFEQMQPNWEGGKIPLIAQLIKIVEQFITSDLIQITPPLFNHEDLKRRLVITLNMNRVVQHIINAIHSDNAESIVPIFDTDRPIRSTSDMQTWYTGKPCEHTKLSHINMCVYDSTWEASEAFEIDRNPNVQSWVKNDHLGFEVLYLHNGIIRKYRPDYLIRLKSGTMIVLEVKGQHDDQSRTKRRFLQEWTRAVNQHGGFGHWQAAMSQHPAEVRNILARQKS